MSVQNKQIIVPFQAAGDLSTKQFYFVKLSAAHTVDVCSGVTDKPIGVLQNKPSAAGQEAEVCISGWTKVQAGGTVTVGTHFNIGTDGNGKAVAYAPGTDTTKFLVGQPVTSGASGSLMEAIINCASAGRGA
jgi:hypothetical protein